MYIKTNIYKELSIHGQIFKSMALLQKPAGLQTCCPNLTIYFSLFSSSYLPLRLINLYKLNRTNLGSNPLNHSTSPQISQQILQSRFIPRIFETKSNFRPHNQFSNISSLISLMFSNYLETLQILTIIN